MDKVFLFLYVVLICLMGAPLAPWVWERWTARESYYSHGPLIILISLYLIYDILRKSDYRMSLFNNNNNAPLGRALLAAGSGLYLLGAVFRVFFVSAIGWLCVAVGIFVLSIDMRALKRLRFPLFFLFLSVPFPMVVTENLAMFLKSVSIKAAACTLGIIGIKAKAVGNMLVMPYSQLEVGAPCSGLRSTLSVFALSLFFTYVRSLNKRVAVVIVLISPLIALSGNIFRITALGFVADVYGSKYAMGFFHDFMGYVAFVFDLFVLFGMEWLLNFVFEVFHRRAKQ